MLEGYILCIYFEIVYFLLSGWTLKCYDQTSILNKTGVECDSSAKYCWKFDRKGIVSQGCEGDKTKLYQGKNFGDSAFGDIDLDSCDSTKIRMGTPVKLIGCKCSTDLCNTGSFIKEQSILLTILTCFLFNITMILM